MFQKLLEGKRFSLRKKEAKPEQLSGLKKEKGLRGNDLIS